MEENLLNHINQKLDVLLAANQKEIGKLRKEISELRSELSILKIPQGQLMKPLWGIEEFRTFCNIGITASYDLVPHLGFQLTKGGSWKFDPDDIKQKVKDGTVKRLLDDLKELKRAS